MNLYNVKVEEEAVDGGIVYGMHFLNGDDVEGGVNVTVPSGGKAHADSLWCNSVDPHALAVWWRKAMGELQSRGIDTFILHVRPGASRLFEFYAAVGFKFDGFIFEGRTS